MTTALLDEWPLAPVVRRQVGDPKGPQTLECAYLVSGVVDPGSTMSGATLDCRRELVGQVASGSAAMGLTIAREIVKHLFVEADPLRALVVGSLTTVVAERIGQATTSLVGTRIRKVIGPIQTPYVDDVGVTCLRNITGSMGRIRNWADRVEYAVSDGGRSWYVDHEPLSVADPARANSLNDSKANASWLKENSASFRGQWIALKEGNLLGADPSRLELTRKLRAAKNLAGAFLVSLKN